jgi:hypothetical protein
MQKFLIIVLGLLVGSFANAQSLNVVKGKVLNADTSTPIAGVKVNVQETDITQESNDDGTFALQNVPNGEQIIALSKEGFEPQFFPVTINNNTVDLGDILLYVDLSQELDNSVITLSEDDLSDDEAGGADNVAGILQSSKDTYQRAIAFNFGQVWFKERGYDSSYGQVSFNGMPMNKISNNRPQWSDWGGLNDALRNQEFSNGLAASETTFGNVLGTTNFITRASLKREGGKISYSTTNSNYNGRVMASYNTGLMDNGWALTVLGSRRYAQEGYMEGSSYNAWGGFIAVEKILNDKHSLNFTAFYTPNRRGKNSPNTQEVFDLGGLKYNAYWGWQGDRKRNSRMKEIKEPTFMLGHYWNINDKTTLNTNIMYQTGTIGNSRFGYKANNPDPTYYQKLPSYFLRYEGSEDYESAYIRANYFLHNDPESQVMWDDLYDANSLNEDATYYLYEDVNEDKTIAVNSVFSSQIDDNITVNGSVLYKNTTSDNYARMMDLMGAQYFTDLDRYASGDEAQMDLNNPDRQILEGDKFNYNYIIDASQFDLFGQAQFTYDKVDFYLAANYGTTGYQRDGLYRNGSYADNSFGKGEKQVFPTYGVKGGVTYKISGRHLLNINAGYMTKAPSLRNTYSNSRVNQDVVPNITTEKILSTDVSYIYRAPGVKARLTGYYTTFDDLNEVSFFYAQGINIAGFDLPDEVTGDSFFLNSSLTGVAKKNIGGEFGAEVQVTPTVSVTGVASLGQYTYDNNPDLYIGSDQFSATYLGTSYLKDYKQSGTPQQGYSLGFSYRDPKYWWVSANANLLSHNYISISPILRTDNFYTDSFGNPVPFNDLTQEEVDTYLAQEKFDDIFLVNLVGGKSWKIKDKYIGFFASINNLLGEEFKTGGFEQSRKANFEELSTDQNLDQPLFGNKYWYGRSTSYYINFYVRF